MKEVTGPIIATALVLCAVFIPTAFISGLTGQFYQQFALTIAISTVISAFNSLTLSPALAASLLKAHDAPKDGFSRLLDRMFGGRSEEHTSELQSLMRISYAVFCLKKKNKAKKSIIISHKK